MAKIVLLGANGQLGSDIVKIFGNSTHDLIALTRDKFDISKVDSLDNITNVDYIINCIAYTNVDGAEEQYSLANQINSAFAQDLAKYCNKYDITLFHISTDYVFEGNQDIFLQEGDITRPRNNYGLTKLSGELSVGNYHDKYFTLRVASLYGVSGASGKGGNFVNTMLKLANTRDSFGVIADQYSNPTHSLDVARCILFFIDNQINEYGLFHCVGSVSCSWYEFAQEILMQAGLDSGKISKLNFDKYKFIAKRPQYTKLSTAKLDRYFVLNDYKTALREYFTIER